MKLALYFIVALSINSCSATPTPPTPEPVVQIFHSSPTRVILFIGDGMGVGAITGTSYLADKKLQMLSMPEFGWMSTHSYEFVTTDSAASASAIATGEKTHFNGVSVKPGTKKENEIETAHHLESFFEIAKKRGLGRGVVSTSRVVHATPAAFYAHRTTRKSYEKIAEDLLSSELDVVFGAGWKYFRSRKDGLDLVSKLKETGYDYFETSAELKKAERESIKAVGLFNEGDMPFLVDANRNVSLPEMVKAATKILDRGHPKGWVLMVEGSFIDWCEHAMRAKCTFAETKDFDDAIGVGLAYAKSRIQNDTLVVATADHETGGLSIIDPPYAKQFSDRIDVKSMKSRPVNSFGLGAYFKSDLKALEDPKMVTAFGSMSVASKMVWSENGRFYAAHTANFVPIFAEGPAAEYISKSRDNATLGYRLKEIVSGEKKNLRQSKSDSPKSIVLFIGDGMGIPAVTLGYYQNGSSSMMALAEHGIVAPQSTDSVVPDAASTASALSTGQLHRRGTLSEANVQTLIERAARAGKSVGIITTAQITDAIPAAFYAHQDSWKKTDGVINSVINFETHFGRKFDLLFGGGYKNLSPHIDTLKTRGYDVYQTWPPKSDGPLIGAFASAALPNMAEKNAKKTDLPSLSEMVKFAINALENNKNGYVLIVHSGQIDVLLHEFRNSELMTEIAAFDNALDLAVQKVDSETLIVVTATTDHTMSVLDNHYGFETGRCGAAKRCGGSLAYSDQKISFPKSELQGEYIPSVILQYAWLVRAAQNPAARKGNATPITGPHSANFVPIFASGPGAERLRGFQTQTDIGQRLNSFVDNSFVNK